MNDDLAKKASPVVQEYRPTLRIKVDVVFHRVRAENTERGIERRSWSRSWSALPTAMNSSVERVGVADKTMWTITYPLICHLRWVAPPLSTTGLGRHHIDFTKANCHSSTTCTISVCVCVCDPAVTMLHTPGHDIDSPICTLHRKSSMRSFFRDPFICRHPPSGKSSQPHCVTYLDLPRLTPWMAMPCERIYCFISQLQSVVANPGLHTCINSSISSWPGYVIL